MVDGATKEGAGKPVTTNKFPINYVPLQESYGTLPLRKNLVNTHPRSRGSNIVIHIQRALLASTLFRITIAQIETTGPSYMYAGVGKRVIKDTQTIRRGDTPTRHSFSVPCPSPGGWWPVQWCISADYEITSPCAGDHVQSAHPDFASLENCIFSVVSGARLLEGTTIPIPGCGGDTQVTLHASCMETWAP